jgi:hypothetical protein
VLNGSNESELGTTSRLSRRESILRIAKRPMGKLYSSFAVICLPNFFCFVALANHLGGDAVNGKIDGGRYYLWGNHWNDAKTYREVSRGVFEYSKWHAYSLFMTWPVMIVGGILLERMGRRLEA